MLIKVTFSPGIMDNGSFTPITNNKYTELSSTKLKGIQCLR
ncbi:hypothetical protein VCHA50O413_10073 [Vibrio chagasii]|nr:hypothetical protein VCHA50O409_10073 [Vibrio chagasii]CAH6959654.1 hypothetical protein VCHA50O402_10073 [Vibrio chagasii]CAH7014609.1 hypothetical protein VCHA50O413_10073 [Vibrio chagasii]CAH7051204.1 hypothetical protein VCHA34P114_80074 [Vibrio chagasii]CAH7096936.1 hypothetical protein VCHA35O142_80095 [Vibrio chagasii]